MKCTNTWFMMKKTAERPPVPGITRAEFCCFSLENLHNTGWKLGYAVAPEPLMEEFRKVHQFNVFSVNTPIQYALAYYMADPQTYLGLGNFQEKRDYFLELMTGSRFKPLKCEGTYFHLYDFSAISDEQDTDFATRITKEHGVATIPVSRFTRGVPEAVSFVFVLQKKRDAGKGGSIIGEDMRRLFELQKETL